MRLIERFAKARNRREHYFGWFVFFFKQKTAYEMDGRLEFRRVLFRSAHEQDRVAAARAPRPAARAAATRSCSCAWAAARTRASRSRATRSSTSPATAATRSTRPTQIGRASCRERGEIEGGAVSLKKKK